MVYQKAFGSSRRWRRYVQGLLHFPFLTHIADVYFRRILENAFHMLTLNITMVQIR